MVINWFYYDNYTCEKQYQQQFIKLLDFNLQRFTYNLVCLKYMRRLFANYLKWKPLALEIAFILFAASNKCSVCMKSY